MHATDVGISSVTLVATRTRSDGPGTRPVFHVDVLDHAPGRTLETVGDAHKSGMPIGSGACARAVPGSSAKIASAAAAARQNVRVHTRVVGVKIMGSLVFGMAKRTVERAARLQRGCRDAFGRASDAANQRDRREKNARSNCGRE